MYNCLPTCVCVRPSTHSYACPFAYPLTCSSTILPTHLLAHPHVHLPHLHMTMMRLIAPWAHGDPMDAMDYMYPTNLMDPHLNYAILGKSQPQSRQRCCINAIYHIPSCFVNFYRSIWNPLPRPWYKQAGLGDQSGPRQAVQVGQSVVWVRQAGEAGRLDS